MGSLVAINTIFDRNIGGKKKVATSNSRYLAVLCSAASRNVLVSFQRYGYPKKALPPPKKKFLQHLFQVYFMEKLNEIVYKYLETKIFSRYKNILL